MSNIGWFSKDKKKVAHRAKSRTGAGNEVKDAKLKNSDVAVP